MKTSTGNSPQHFPTPGLKVWCQLSWGRKAKYKARWLNNAEETRGWRYLQPRAGRKEGPTAQGPSCRQLQTHGGASGAGPYTEQRQFSPPPAHLTTPPPHCPHSQTDNHCSQAHVYQLSRSISLKGSNE